jgi:hypothetical protein
MLTSGRLAAGAALLLAVIGLIWAIGGGGGDSGQGSEGRAPGPAVIEEAPAVLSEPTPDSVERTLRRATRVRRAVRADRRTKAHRRSKPSKRENHPPSAPPAPQPEVAPPAPSAPLTPPAIPSGSAPEFL